MLGENIRQRSKVFTCEMSSCYVGKEIASHASYGQGKTYLEVRGLEVQSEDLFLKGKNVSQQYG